MFIFIAGCIGFLSIRPLEKFLAAALECELHKEWRMVILLENMVYI